MHCSGCTKYRIGGLDFPDEVLFPEAAVKGSASKSFLVRNVGSRPVKFSFHTQSPFSITPNDGYLEVNSTLQVTITFSPEVSIGVFGDTCL